MTTTKEYTNYDTETPPEATGEIFLHESDLPTLRERYTREALERARTYERPSDDELFARSQEIGRGIVSLPEVPEVERPLVTLHEYLQQQAERILLFRRDAMELSKRRAVEAANEPPKSRTPYWARKAASLLVGDTDSLPHFHRKPKNPPVLTERGLINRESEVGSQIFGGNRDGYTCQFFMITDNSRVPSWVWYEKTKRGVMSTRYESQPRGVLKAQEGGRYSYLEGEELQNFIDATRLYLENVATDVYKRDAYTGQYIG